jgi:hypothetical protein
MTRPAREALGFWGHAFVQTFVYGAISEAFGVIGPQRALAIISTDALQLDDIELHERADRLAAMLGIPLELPLMKQPLGRLADYCQRKLIEKERGL